MIDTRANWLARVSEAARGLAATHVQEQFGNGTSRSPLGATTLIDRVQLVPELDRWPGPIISPARSWQLQSKPTLAVVVGLVGLMAAVALTDVIPIGQFPSSDFWRQLTLDRGEFASWSAPPAPALSSVQAEPTIAGLIVRSSHEMSGKPARLGLALEGQPEGAVVTITGLLPGMELSNGEPFGTTAWRLPAMDLGDIWISPPDKFVGSIDLHVELRLPDDRVVDWQAMHLEWLP